MNPYPPPPVFYARPYLVKVLGSLALVLDGSTIYAGYVLRDWNDEVADGEDGMMDVARDMLPAYFRHAGPLAFGVQADDGETRTIIIDVLPPNAQGWLL